MDNNSATLLLRLAGPMQSWGLQSRFTVRDTAQEPTKSGVIGLVCAALGRPREEPVDDLSELQMGVRVDREGTPARDYQTAGGALHGDDYGVAAVAGKSATTVLSNRYYLADADFLVGLHGELELLTIVERAIREPHWPLYLGRKAFVPGIPITVPGGLLPGYDLTSALQSWPWPGVASSPPTPDKRPPRLRAVLQTVPEQADRSQQDQPVGAAYSTRRFTVRYTRTTFWDLGTTVPIRGE